MEGYRERVRLLSSLVWVTVIGIVRTICVHVEIVVVVVVDVAVVVVIVVLHLFFFFSLREKFSDVIYC
jgi:hypothetical protein